MSSINELHIATLQFLKYISPTAGNKPGYMPKLRLADGIYTAVLSHFDSVSNFSLRLKQNDARLSDLVQGLHTIYDFIEERQTDPKNR